LSRSADETAGHPQGRPAAFRGITSCNKQLRLYLSLI
jgi:hypothetical protein